MANEISWRHSATGETLYFTIRNASRQMWNTSGTPNFETLTVANWADYQIAMTESPADSYFYVGTFPAIAGNMVAGWYWVDVYSGSSGIDDTLVATMVVYFNGTTASPWDSNAAQWGGSDTIDGVSLANFAKYILGCVAGNMTVVKNGDGTITITMLAQDGETELMTDVITRSTSSRTRTIL